MKITTIVEIEIPSLVGPFPVPGTETRILESGELRVTEDGISREIEGKPKSPTDQT